MNAKPEGLLAAAARGEMPAEGQELAAEHVVEGMNDKVYSKEEVGWVQHRTRGKAAGARHVGDSTQ